MKWLFLCTAFFLTIAKGLGQDTSKLSAGKQLKNNADTLNTIVDPNGPGGNPNHMSSKAHSAVNPNRGTSIPNTTSGTLNSTVNPNTQFVIPFHKKRKKPAAIPDSGSTAPKR